MSHILVTGGAGFIGSNLVKELLKQGHVVSVIDNLITGRKENLAAVLSNIKFIEGSILEEEKINQAIEGVDYVLHVAALPSVPRSLNDPQLSLENNVAITLKILQKSVEHKIKKLVYSSSSSIYGDQDVLAKIETLTPAPISPYAVYKSAGEQLCRIFSQAYHLPTVSLRYFNVFGPNQDPDSPYSAVIPLFIKQILNGQSPTINGDGFISRDFTFVDNNVVANILAMNSDKVGQGETINIACGQSIFLNQLVEEINHCLGTSIKAIYGPERAGDIKHSLADISLAKKLIGYEPTIDFNEGLKRTVEFYKL
ncbi:MAG: SDR family oxidoreductase [Candidatus Komeilibacteria bacterium]|nr:SDR family oxidoreductase [Candidatus Komeilibacteria bacterium]